MESDIPPNSFYLAIKGGFSRTASSFLCLRDFIPNSKELLERMKQQGPKRATISTSLRKIILAHPKSRVFPTLLYFMPGLPKHFLRR